MRILKYITIFTLSVCFLASCKAIVNTSNKTETTKTFNYLAIGDSYTKGESVCSSCGFPSITANALELKLKQPVSLTQIAETGWTTTQLINAISKKQPEDSYDLVTLLIGVNNQFQGKPFSLYEREFVELLDTAILRAGGDISKVLVISIPDYAYTPFGEQSGKMLKISEEIDAYNNFAKKTASKKNVAFINITDITRNGLKNPELVAKDGLHPSKEAYQLFTERILKHLDF